MYEWMTIECAPQSGHAILVYAAQSKCTFTAYWNDDRQEWKSFGGDAILQDWNEPTHWMPLPPHPKVGA